MKLETILFTITITITMTITIAMTITITITTTVTSTITITIEFWVIRGSRILHEGTCAALTSAQCGGLPALFLGVLKVRIHG